MTPPANFQSTIWWTTSRASSSQASSPEQLAMHYNLPPRRRKRNASASGENRKRKLDPLISFGLTIISVERNRWQKQKRKFREQQMSLAISYNIERMMALPS